MREPIERVRPEVSSQTPRSESFEARGPVESPVTVVPQDIVLDLDQTLVSSYEYGMCGMAGGPVVREAKPRAVFTSHFVDSDGEPECFEAVISGVGLLMKLRPGVRSFVRYLRQCLGLVVHVYTKGRGAYMKVVLDLIDSKHEGLFNGSQVSRDDELEVQDRLKTIRAAGVLGGAYKGIAASSLSSWADQVKNPLMVERLNSQERSFLVLDDLPHVWPVWTAGGGIELGTPLSRSYSYGCGEGDESTTAGSAASSQTSPSASARARKRLRCRVVAATRYTFSEKLANLCLTTRRSHSASSVGGSPHAHAAGMSASLANLVGSTDVSRLRDEDKFLYEEARTLVVRALCSFLLLVTRPTGSGCAKAPGLSPTVSGSTMFGGSTTLGGSSVSSTKLGIMDRRTSTSSDASTCAASSAVVEELGDPALFGEHESASHSNRRVLKTPVRLNAVFACFRKPGVADQRRASCLGAMSPASDSLPQCSVSRSESDYSDCHSE